MREMRQTALVRMRKERGLTKAELARRAHLDAGIIAWIESGRFIPYYSQLEKLARALEYTGSPYDIAEEEEPYPLREGV